jgi:uncharacterized protein DUF5916
VNLRLFPALALLLGCGSLFAQAEVQSLAERRVIKAVRAEQAPEIDGVPDEPFWQAAQWQGDFIQLKPSPGEPARAKTLIAVAYDDTHIYAAFRCFNPPGSSVNSKINRRDGNMDQDNAVTLYLDSFHTRRDCYYFSTNSLGTQVDGRIGEDGRSNDKNWDCIWQVKSREDSLGWTAEMAIPANEIRFPEGEGNVWGINFRRNYPEFFETSFWTERDAAWRISRSGDLQGLGRFRKKFSAALYPYLVALNSNTPSSDRRTVYSSGGTEAIAGVDMRFNLGATANGNLTYNPDFATVEADLEVINLTRWETFYPEKRLYFLEGAELFKTRFNVFHSRRIGDIDLGLKTNGRLGEYNFAVLSAHERAVRGNPASQTSVFRLQRDVFKASNIGLIAVDRSWSGGHNRVLSTDATINFAKGYRISSQYVGGFASEGDLKSAYYAQLSRQAQLYNYTFGFTSIDPGFRENVNPVGFIQDDDRREVNANGGHAWWIRKHGIDKINSNFHTNVFWSHAGALRNVGFGGWVGVTFLDRWLVGYAKNYHTELFEKRYRNHNQLWEMGYNQQSWNNFGLLHVWGKNFDADYHRIRLRTNLKPSRKIAFSYAITYLTLSPDPDRRSTKNHNLSTDYNFTPDIWLRLISQYSTRNDRFYLYGLFGWRFSPPFGALYLAYTADRFDQFDDLLDPVYREKQRAFFVKLTVPLSL